MIIKKILESRKIGDYIIKHNLLKQYKKVKEMILNGNLNLVDFKKRRPYKTEKYYFKINKQYRAFAYLEGEVLKIFEINDHQN